MTYERWLEQVPNFMKREQLWETGIYRRALYAYDLAWEDCDRLLPHDLGKPNARQLIRSIGSISANIEEGYGRSFGKDYARFLRIALGSARESRGWYWRSRHILNIETVTQRINLLDSIISGLIKLSNQQKNYR